MLFPVKILDFDLAAPSTGDVPVSSRYRRARVLVRWSGHPIGTVHVSVHSGAVRRQDILAAVVDKLAYSLAVEFARHSLLHTGAPGSFQPASRSAFSLRRDAPGVSVVICTRDRPDDIARCLTAVAALAPAPLEVIVVDNAPATEATAALLRTRFPSFRYVREDQPGLDHARNRGIREARGEVIAFTDDDVVVDPTWAGALANAFASDPAVGLVTGLVEPYELETEAQLLFETYGGFGRGYRRHYLRAAEDGRLTWNQIGAGQLGAGASMAVRRELFSRTGLFDPALDVGTGTRCGGDHEIFFRLIKSGCLCVYEPAALVRHRHRRTLEEFRRLMYDYGHGTRAFFDRVEQHFPEDAAALRKLRRWWWREWAAKRWWRAASRPSPFSASFVRAEIKGYRDGAGAYARVRRQLVPDESRRPDFFQVTPPPTVTRHGTGTVFVEVTRPLRDLAEAAEYQAVHVVVQRHGEPLGSVRVAADGHVISAAHLADEIAATLAFAVLQPHQPAGAAWAQFVGNLPGALGVAREAPPSLPESASVTIVIATCDRPDQLRRCLASLTRLRTARSVQTLVVDNRPAAGSAAAVVAEFPGVELVAESRPGSSFARNAGIAAARGEIVAMTDDDMIVTPEWLENLLRPFARGDVMAVTGNTLPARTETEAEHCFETYGGFCRGFTPVDYTPDWFYKTPRRAAATWRIGGTGNAAFRREIFARPDIGPFDERLGAGMPTGVGEDTQMFYAILRAGFTIVYEPAAIAWHHHRITMPQLRAQLHAYSKGHVAYHLVTLFRYRDTRALHRLLYELPRSLAQRLWERARGRYAYPWRLLATEVAGTFAGPWSLWRAHRIVRRLRAAPAAPRVSDPAPLEVAGQPSAHVFQ